MKDLSKKNPYWIEHHRYLELEHFCRQYPIWCKAVTAMCGLSSKTYADVVIDEDHSSPVEKSVIKRESYMDKITMVQKAADEAAGDLSIYILAGVTEGAAYEDLLARMNIPCCRDVYYDLRRRFFYILSKMRE